MEISTDIFRERVSRMTVKETDLFALATASTNKSRRELGRSFYSYILHSSGCCNKCASHLRHIGCGFTRVSNTCCTNLRKCPQEFRLLRRTTSRC